MNAAVILAAGASRRMGTPKALVQAGGRPFVARIAEAARAAGCARVVVVVGPPHEAAIAAALPAGAEAVRNPAPERGMLSSVQAGVAALAPEVAAALIWPVDVPLVAAETARAILAGGDLVVPTHAGRGGHPVRVPRARFAELLALPPKAGLRALMTAATRLPVDDPHVLVDFDTPADLDKLT